MEEIELVIIISFMVIIVLLLGSCQIIWHCSAEYVQVGI